MAFSQWILWLDRRARRRQGSILIFVLVLLAIIAAMLIQSQLQVRGRLDRAAEGLGQARMQAALTDGMLQALQVLADDENLMTDYPGEPWTEPVEYRDPTGIAVTLQIEDLNRYFDLNNLSIKSPNPALRSVEEITLELMAQCGDLSPSDRMQSLQDWVDANREGFRETSFYEDQTPPYATPDRWLSSWDELNWVNGFSREYFQHSADRASNKDYEYSLLDTFTLIPTSRDTLMKLNVNTVPRHVMIGVLGLSAVPFIDQIMLYRRDNAIASMDKLNFLLDEPLASNFTSYFDVKSSFFSVVAQAYLSGQSARAQAWVYRKPDGSVEVIRWVR